MGLETSQHSKNWHYETQRINSSSCSEIAKAYFAIDGMFIGSLYDQSRGSGRFIDLLDIQLPLCHYPDAAFTQNARLCTSANTM